MTQKEIDKFLAGTKVYVAGKSKEVQEKLFSLGYKWNEVGTVVSFTECPFLYIDNKRHISYGCDMENFSNHENREISAEEILSLELTEPTYRPFKDKDECWNEMLKHQPFGWLKHKYTVEYQHIYCVMEEVYLCGVGNCSYKGVFSLYTFADGAPFGIKED